MDKPRLLVVEDHEGTRHVLRSLFIRLGWEVRVAGTIAEGLALLEPPPHCVLLDLMLPDGGGEIILRRIRAGHLPIRVVLTSGCGDPARLRQVQSLKPEALLQKPVDFAEVCRVC